MIKLKTKNKKMAATKNSFTDIDCLVCEIRTKDVYKDLSSDKEMFDLSNSSTKSKEYDDSNKLVTGKIKYETKDVAINEFVGLKLRMYSFLVDNSSEHKKSWTEMNRIEINKVMNRNAVK